VFRPEIAGEIVFISRGTPSTRKGTSDGASVTPGLLDREDRATQDLLVYRYVYTVS
jgi:hypothetical protein